jgi:galactokinase/mevalonate kinase-like predicted kinase
LAAPGFVTSWLGKRSYKARVQRLGIERIREIARENGKKGGRPKRTGNKKNQRNEE